MDHGLSTTGINEATSSSAMMMLNVLIARSERRKCRAEAPSIAQAAPHGMAITENSNANATLIAIALQPLETAP